MHDWVKIKVEYITTRISYRSLAKKYGVGVSTLQKRATREGWARGREEYKVNVMSTVCQKIAGKQLNTLEEIYDSADILRQKLENILMVNDFCAKTFRDIAQGLRVLEDMKRRQLNMLTEIERQKMEIEHERLAIDKARYSTQDWDEGSTGVVILADIKADEG